jgi:hypothetical protein
VALVLPEATTTTMGLFLAEFAAGLPGDVHAVLVLDRAGWHGAKALAVPANVTLVPLPPYSPELNPVERVWLLPARALPLAAGLRRLPADRRRLLRRLEPARRSPRAHSAKKRFIVRTWSPPAGSCDVRAVAGFVGGRRGSPLRTAHGRGCPGWPASPAHQASG